VTSLLEQAFLKATQLSSEEQDLLAEFLLAELEADNAFDRAIEESAHKLATLAEEALAEDEAGLTECLDPDRL
jgi:hypothetical protein